MKRIKALTMLVGFIFVTAVSPVRGQTELGVEYGFLGVIDHTIKLSENGTLIDYRDDGGQNNLFPFWRVAAAYTVAPHKFYLLYQPLRLETIEVTDRDLLIDNLEFPAGTPVQFSYGFPFYRLGYTYMWLLGEEERVGIGLGGALQVRNANITFTSLNGELFRASRDVGLVPLAKLVAYWSFETFRFETEIDGIYAPVKYLNLSDNDVEGAFLDASARIVFTPAPIYGYFVNLRYLGGGAEGTSEDDGPGDGYVENWLDFLTLTLGLRLTI